MTPQEKEFKRKYNDKMQDILSSGFSLVDDYNKMIIQSSGYGAKDFIVMEYNGDNQTEFETLDEAIKYIERKRKF